MLDESRIGIYNYIYELLYGSPSDGKVTENVYCMNQPEELTTSDTQNGFIVIRVGQLNDESEFHLQTYGWVRAYVEVYVPTMSRGRLNTAKYQAWENAVNSAINNEIAIGTSTQYAIQNNGILTLDGNEESNADNRFHMFIKSFIVNIEGDNTSSSSSSSTSTNYEQKII